ncbi:glycoside hydrolase family 3 N-terminal domain-containing protein [Lutimonas halocynthiae]|uniref:glycoside hydrolase family 3 protein n=1 Tax=Lutimonas halocynthiae TaxID=1446477 RepID=UPI0025B52820|nr:glycoside hydrolase family 3 protein [Lutimonas halocynthiae]MDN3643254.1 glycoside hydrolase family 3 N-terminal domain-containing protein [Lutimonas halocynthiae]
MNKAILVFLGLILLASCKPAKKEVKENQLLEMVTDKSQVILEKEGVRFRDLNKNEKLDVYEDANQAIEARVEDLLSQMTLEEKAGMMFINGAPISEDGLPDGKQGLKGSSSRMKSVVFNMDTLKMNHFNIWSIPADLNIFAKWYNATQQVAEKTRLGIPVTIASDPRHHFSNSIFSLEAKGFSQFCETLGLAAIGDAALVKEFANIVREEYLAVGIRESLHPQIDLATEPRWARINGAFGEDAQLTARMVTAYIEGMQGETLNENSIACMTKHFPGGGPQKEGLDPHFSFQKGQIYPGDNFDYHLIPFEAAFEANTAAIMPYYGIPTDQTDENVAMAYNKAIITTLLREKYKYDGVVCTDWGLISDLPMGPDVVWKARAWGVEDLNAAERALKIIDAGCDQFGGENRPELVVQLVKEGKLSEERIDESITRLLRQKFQLGLFDNPFVDEGKVAAVINKKSSKELGERTQKESMTLLKNKGETLPISKNMLKVYIENIDSITVAGYAMVVKTPQEADLAIIRLNTPWYPVDTKVPMAKGFHHGDLDFKGEEKARILKLLKTVPTVVNLYLDRPAVIPEISEAAQAVIADYGASDQSVCEVLFGNASPKGKLPFELPSSMEAVYKQKTDVPYDSENPLFEFGFGLTYQNK